MESNYKIAIIGIKGLPGYGGTSTGGQNLALSLKDKYDFTVLSVSTHTKLCSGDYKGLHQVVFKSKLGNTGFNTAIYYFRALFYVLFHHFDLVQLHLAATGFMVPLLKMKSKVVLTVRGYSEEYDPKFTNFQNWLCNQSTRIGINNANVVVSVSKPDQQLLLLKYNREILYIPNGIFSSEPINCQKPVSNGYLLFAAGRIYDIKGLHLLLKAAHSINFKGHIVVAGDIDRVPDYRQQIFMLAEGLDVQFLGLITEKQKLMEVVSKASVFVFPSLHEGMSMMLLEVVSQCVPVIASDIPANTSVFNSHEMLFFNSNNSEDLASKIEYAFTHYDSMCNNAHAAYNTLSENYTWNSIGQKYDAIYSRLIANKK